MPYCLYLRKSRADAEAELRGEGETLARHEAALMALARRFSYDVAAVYREIVSGETIAARPEMQRLLQDVELEKWDGVLVMEVERLARGDTVDQGIVARTFQYSGTKIITPMKVYDPANEFDEEYFEFGLFMSRREYKTINRRLQAGRFASVKEGKYVGSRPPYGYRRIRLAQEKGFTLEPVPEQARVVQLIFDLYANGEPQPDGSLRPLGADRICKKLNAMNIPSQKDGIWTVSSIRDILKNPVYIGKIRWNARPAKKMISNGEVVRRRVRAAEDARIVVDGIHPAIIDDQLFFQAQKRASHPHCPLSEQSSVKNPLAGVVVCGLCGRTMIRRPAGGNRTGDVLMCPEPSCGNVSASLFLVEQRVMQGLATWAGGYRIPWNARPEKRRDPIFPVQKAALARAAGELRQWNSQLDNAHDLLEQGVYSADVFQERARYLKRKIGDAETAVRSLRDSVRQEPPCGKNTLPVSPPADRISDLYWLLPSAQAKNEMLRLLLKKIIYKKTADGRYRDSFPDDFELTLYPRLPKQPRPF